MSRCVGNGAGGNGTELGVAGFLMVGRELWRVEHESADTAPGPERAVALEVGVDLGHGVGVDPQRHRELPDRWQLIARAQAARGDGGPDAALELRVQRRRVARVHAGGPVEIRHRPLLYYFNSTKQPRSGGSGGGRGRAVTPALWSRVFRPGRCHTRAAPVSKPTCR